MALHVHKVWIRAVLLTITSCVFLHGQENPTNDSANAVRSSGDHRMELGINALGAGIEYRHQLQSFLSLDAIASAHRPGAAIGATMSVFSFFVLQGVFGTGTFEEAMSTDGPPAFKPNYLYGWKAGIQFPVAPRKTDLYVLFAAGQLKYVQSHYQYNGGGFLIGTPPPPAYRKETRVREIFSVGLGFRF